MTSALTVAARRLLAPMHRLRWRGATLATLAALCASSVGAVDAEAALRASQRVLQAAGPWCGRWAELDRQGVRRCVLPVRTVASEHAVAISAFGSVLLTDAIVRGLDGPALAFVLGHEVAHFASRTTCSGCVR